MSGYRLRTERGLVWPADDVDCAAVVFDTPPDMDEAILHCRSHDVAVQAGGNCGVWPKYLSSRFGVVYTFEPDPLNFRCLAQNCDEPNIVKMQAALGDVPGFIDLKREARNIGAHYVEGHGIIPTLRIDDLGLEACDYICLDIEGYEFKALSGAVDTIRKFGPVIQIEDKGLSDKYGTQKGHIEEWLMRDFGYEVLSRPHRDVILVCRY